MPYSHSNWQNMRIFEFLKNSIISMSLSVKNMVKFKFLNQFFNLELNIFFLHFQQLSNFDSTCINKKIINILKKCLSSSIMELSSYFQFFANFLSCLKQFNNPPQMNNLKQMANKLQLGSSQFIAQQFGRMKFQIVNFNKNCIIQKILSDSFYSTMMPIQQLIAENNNSGPAQSKNNMPGQVAQPIDPYLFSMLNYQNYLSLELMKNQIIMNSYLEDKTQHEKIATYTNLGAEIDLMPQSTFYRNENSDKVELGQYNQKQQQDSCLSKNSKKMMRKHFQDEEYTPEAEELEKTKKCRFTQSKNVPKNFSKALILFINKEQKLVKKLAEEYGVDFDEFLKQSNGIKGKINTIAQLRSLWIDQQNRYSRLYRILCGLYIRKYSIRHIFNSRIQDYKIHLKYQHIIMEALKNPKEFSSMKNY